MKPVSDSLKLEARATYTQVQRIFCENIYALVSNFHAYFHLENRGMKLQNLSEGIP